MMTGAAWEGGLREFLSTQRWFAGKADGVASLTISDRVPLKGSSDGREFELVCLDVTSQTGVLTTYVMPVCAGSSGQIEECSAQLEFWRALLGELQSSPDGIVSQGLSRLVLRRIGDDSPKIDDRRITIHSAEQSNTSVVLGESHFLKLFRRPGNGVNPDVEICSFLTTQTSFTNSPRVEAVVELVGGDRDEGDDRDEGGATRCIALISEFVRCDGDAWQFTLQQIEKFWGQVADQANIEGLDSAADWRAELHSGVFQKTSATEQQLFAGFLDEARLLGRRTAELHAALASGSIEPAFAPEPLMDDDWQALLDGIEEELGTTCDLIVRVGLPGIDAAEMATRLMEHGRRKLAALREWSPGSCGAMSTRCHGDYHLGQVLRSAHDFVIIDFEGEPDRPLSERREKRSPLKDVAGMIRSLHYASNAASVGLVASPASSISEPERWQRYWYERCVSQLLTGYRETVSEAGVVPESSDDFLVLLDAFLIEKVLYELRYEINNRPDWVAIPLRGLSSVLGL